MTSSGTWNITLAGECMVCRPFMVHDEPEFKGVLDLLGNSDVTYAHLEMNFAHHDELKWPARGQGTGSFMMADPGIAKELKAAGVDLMSIAHNHSFDFGAEGLLATKKHCEEAGLAVSGTGADLELASEPTYVEKKKGRVALVSVSSGNQHFMWGGLAKGGLRGRPGVNPLRLSYDFVVDEQTAANLKAFGEKLNVMKPAKSETPGAFGILLPSAQQWGDVSNFVVGDEFDIVSRCHQRDLERNLRSVEEARAMADLVMVAHHFSVSDGPRGHTPPKFAEDFAHAVIDGGADIYVAHGWHRTLGIEIYKGKPIFYGMGNFFAQTEFIQRVPYDSYDAYGHDVDRLPTLHSALHPLHPGGQGTGETWWNSAIIQVEVEAGELKRIHLHPVEMGREFSVEAPITRQTGSGSHPFTEGRPILAKGETAHRTLERIRRLSADYGTNVEINGTVATIDLTR